MAALAVAAAFTFTACSDDDNKSSGNNKPTDLLDLVVNMGSAYFQYSQTGDPNVLLEGLVATLGGQTALVPKTVDFGMPDADGNGEGVMELHTEGFSTSAEGKYGPLQEALEVAETPITSKARISGINKIPFQYVTFQYQYDKVKDVYEIPNFASLKFQPAGALMTFKNISEPIILPGKLEKDVIKLGDNTSYNCRAWAIEKILVEVQKNGKQTVGETFTTTNLYDIATQVQDKHDVKISSDDKDKLEALGSIEKITFATNGRLSFYFSKGKIYTGTWKWNNMGKGEISYNFEKSNMKNAFIEQNGIAKVDYKLNSKTIEVIANYKNDNSDKYKISTLFYVKPYKTIKPVK